MSKSPKIFKPVVATANDLVSGAVAFRSQSGQWLADLQKAFVALDAESAQKLETAAQDDVARNRVIDLALIGVKQTPDGLRPDALRETIRAQGPTISLPPART